MKKTKIICTIGPSSEDDKIIEQLILNGMNAARLNFSHGDYEEHKQRILKIKAIREKLGSPIAIVLDTKGPEIRTGVFKDGKVQVNKDEEYIFTTREVIGDNKICSITYAGLVNDIKVGEILLVDDGLVAFCVEKIEDTQIYTRVLNTGIIGTKKGVNVPGASINLPPLTQKDINDIKFGIENEVDIIAASFVRKAQDVIELRRVLERNGGEKILVISKIESREGVENIDDIIRFSDGIMVARGDLGVELPVEEVPLVQKMIIEKCNKAGKPVITATQMLDSMIRNPRPTRAEVTDVANAIFDGTDCIMLSGETASGIYPVEAVKTMAKIAERTEKALDYSEMLEDRKIKSAASVADAISYTACTTAEEIRATAIIAATMTGHTARRISKFRPKQPIIAVSPYEYVARKLAIIWGVYPMIAQKMETSDEIIDYSVKMALKTQFVKKGELVIIAAGVPVGLTGTTNMIKVHIAGDTLVEGRGIGINSVFGNAVVINEAMDINDAVNIGNIIIIKRLEKDYITILDKISGVVSEEGGFTSHFAMECISRGIPIIVGAEGACDIIKSGAFVTMDTARGIVFPGKATIK